MRAFDRLVILAALAALLGLGIPLTEPAAKHALATPAPTPAPLPTAPPPRLVREGLVGAITTLDPLFAASDAERSVSALLSCGLTRLGPGDEILPDLAATWNVSDRGSVYTFRLRGDVRWHDGESVTAADVVSTVLAIRDPAYDGPYRGRWDRILVEKLDRWTVRFRLAAPLPGFLSLTTQPLVPEHLLGAVPVAQRRADRLAKAPVGCGPFEMGAPLDDGLVLVRVGPTPAPSPTPSNPLGPPPEPTPRPADPRRALVPGFRFTLFPEPAALESAFADGRLDSAAGVSPQAVERLGAMPGVSVVRYPTPILRALVPNLRFDRRTFQDPHVRRALLLAIDREALIRDVLGGEGVVAPSLIPPASSLFDPDASVPVPFDPDQAARELTAAGWFPGTNGWVEPGHDTPEPVVLLAVDDPLRTDTRAVAEQVVASWRAVGFQAELRLLPAAELIEGHLRPGSFDLALLDLDLGLDPDLFPLLASSQAQSGGTNLAGYQSAETDALLAAARRPADAATRRERFAALERRLADELPMLPLAFGESTYLVRSTLVGPAPRLIPVGSDRFWNVLAWRIAGTDTG